MARTQSAGRNDLCSCGSGKKFKKCCAQKAKTGWGGRAMAALVLAVLVGGIVAVVMSFGETPSATPQPGQVWSPEHGHYH